MKILQMTKSKLWNQIQVKKQAKISSDNVEPSKDVASRFSVVAVA